MKLKVTLLALTISTVFAGCGGGGGGGGSTAAPASPPVSTTPTAPTTPAPDPSALQTTVPTPSYGAGSFQLAAFNRVNQARMAYGVGQVAQNALLDTAAQNHANYIDGRFKVGDYVAQGHAENPEYAGFTGAAPADRIAFAKYAAVGTGEGITGIVAVDGVASDPGTVAIDALLSGPYHRLGLLSGYREIGLGRTAIRLPGEGGEHNTLVADYATPQGSSLQAPADGWIGLWPVDNATNVLYGFGGETPNPIPANNGQCAGYPVSLQARQGKTLAVTSFTLNESANGAAISVQLSTPTTDVNPAYAFKNAAYIIPYRPLKAGTKYTAHFVGTQDGVAIDKSWSFTTTAQNVKLIHGCDPG